MITVFKIKQVKRVVVGFAFLSFTMCVSTIAQAQIPIAAFSTDTLTGCSPLTIQFTNTSVNATSFQWDFGNGNTSVLQNPTNVYLNESLYTVSLIATGAGGASDTLTMVDVIDIIGKPVVGFSVQNVTSCLDGNNFSFINTTTQATYWLWDFGDGYTSSQQQPTHHYDMAGVFSVTLIAGNADSCLSIVTKPSFITVFADWQVEMQVDTTAACDVSHDFSFITPATGVVSWSWDFGDGTTSNQQNPSHFYINPGQYTVTLSVVNANGCSDTLIMPDFIQINSGPQPGIISDLTSGCIPLIATFEDSSSSSTSWLWNFGDGTTDTAHFPTHTYSDSGMFDVSLTATNSSGCTNTKVVSNFINAQALPNAQFELLSERGCSPFTTKFDNKSGNATSWYWDFGNGDTSTIKFPKATYTAPGTYTVSLIAFSNNSCSDTITKVDVIHVLDPIAAFETSVKQGCAPLLVSFSDSSIGATEWLWTFDDGSISTEQNPVHIYNTAGSFDAFLVVKNSYGCSDTMVVDSSIQARVINPSYTSPAAYYGCAPFNIGFEDNRPGAIGWIWDFGDGTDMDTNRIASHIYTVPGTYTVSLQSSSDVGCDQFIPNHSTFIIDAGEAEYVYEFDVCDHRAVLFSDSSEYAVSWLWSFGDSSTSTMQHPAHVYTNYGWYIVTLQITTMGGCTYSVARMITVKPREPMASPTMIASDSTYPLTVDFTANSPTAIAWWWYFGDSLAISTQENPTHFYASAPAFTVTLVVSDGICTDTLHVELPSRPNPGASFGTIPDTTAIDLINSSVFACRPFQIQFQNEFLNSGWYIWDFGDGNSSTLPNPIHTYTQAGVYDIRQIGINESGFVDTLLLPGFINLGGSVAKFTSSRLQVCDSVEMAFIDSSTRAVQWHWDFGDGKLSTDQHPNNFYPLVNTTYPVSLEVMDTMGCTDRMMKSINIGLDEPQFTYDKTACVGEVINFQSSLSSMTSWSWDFGDGILSTDSFAAHSYLTGGKFAITLSAVDMNGCSILHALADSVEVSDPRSSFTISGNTTGCNAVSIVLDNTSTGATSYLWDFGDGGTSSLTAPAKQYTAPGQYTISLTSAKDGCQHKLTYTDTVQVNEAVADFAFTQNTHCLPITVTLFDSSYGAVNWLWSFGDGTTGVTAQAPTHTFTNVPSGDITLTIVDSIGCMASMAKPNIDILIADFALSTTIGCAPLESAFQDNSQNAVQWAWDFGDGSSSTNNSPSHIYQDTGYFTVQLVVTASGGCTDTMTLADIVSVRKPKADFNATTPPACAPSLVNLVNTSQRASFWSWNFGDGSGSSNVNPNHIYLLPGSYSVSLMVTDSIGCSDTLIKPNYITILGPVASFISDTIEGCEGLELNLTDQSSDATMWEWNFGNGSASTVQHPQLTYEEAGSYAISLIVEDTAGCTSFHVMADSIMINQVPQSSFLMSDTVGCSPLNCSLTNQSEKGHNYLWDFGDSQVDTMPISGHVFQSGDYTVSLIVTSDYGCADTSNRQLTVHQSPVADFESSVLAGCYPLSVDLTSFSSDLEDPFYLWNINGVNTSKAENPSVLLENTGLIDITLIVTNANGCIDTLSRPAYIKVADTLTPESSPIFTATVYSNTEVGIVWEPSVIEDFDYYNLLQMDPGSGVYNKIATIDDRNVDGYINDGLNTLSNSYCYKIQTTDLCGNKADVSELTTYCTMNVSSQTVSSKINVSWTPYRGCTVQAYQVFRMESGEQHGTLIAEVSAMQLTFTDSTIICPESYSYRVKAKALCGSKYTSFSDTTIAQPVDNIFLGQHVDVARTTVVDNNAILSEWAPPAIAADYVNGYTIFRSTDTVNYTYLEAVPAAALQYLDETVSVQEQNYFYKIEVLNECDVQNQSGTQGSSILLTTQKINDLPVLFWTQYESWEAGVEKYIIQEKDTNGKWIKVGTVGGSSNQLIIER